ncbi:hypothetical protein KM800_02830 [Clostridium tyrobutyricum]|uniref:hypothetical protein n=1 Tax=Clostridium tyrobutyricum TaxID=1519 RepID=UPI001C382933|nr:hypothetical protein [Clostridium tyrobutyricum]MBV4418268.1 hypothetical protein [Clostridium tyrobutyricum]
MDKRLEEQLEEIYKCEGKLEENRNNHIFDTVERDQLLARLELAAHEIYLIHKQNK